MGDFDSVPETIFIVFDDAEDELLYIPQVYVEELEAEDEWGEMEDKVIARYELAGAN